MEITNFFLEQREIGQFLILAVVGSGLSTLGLWLSLKRNLLLANGFSHTTLLGMLMALSFFPGLSILETPVLLLSAFFSAVLYLSLHRLLTVKWGFSEDSSLSISFTFLFALGVLWANLYYRSLHLGQEAVMGSLDLLSPDTALPLLSVTLFLLFCFFLFLRGLTLTCFDSIFCGFTKTRPLWFNLFLYSAAALLIVLSFSVMGLILVMGFITIPPLACRFFASTMKSWWIFTLLFTVLSSILTVFLSFFIYKNFYIALSTSALSVVIMGVLFFIALFSSTWYRKVIAE